MLTLKSKRLASFLIASMLSMTLCASVAYASGKSLDEIAAGSQQQVTTETVVDDTAVVETNKGLDSTSAGFISVVNSTTDMTKENKLDNSMVNGASNLVSKLVQTLIFFISLGVILLVVVDVAYILFAPLRGILAPAAAGGGMAPGGMGGMSGGMGGMGMGMRGGYGSRMGMGGYGSRMGGMGMGGMSGGMGGMNPMAGRNMGSQKVSDTAVQAVMMAQQGGNALTIYASKMAVTIVLSLAICILAATGVLSTLGLTIGVKMAEAIASITKGMV